MNKNEKFIITINRELGSGGRTIGEKLAARLGVPFYDKAIIKGTVEKHNLTKDEVEKLKGRSHSWWAELQRAASIGMGVGGYTYSYSLTEQGPDMLTTDEMFQTEKEILRGIAETQSCVIAGRSGFYVLRDMPNRLSILIQAPMESRIQRVMRKQGLNREDAEKTIRKIDKMRENYVSKYCGISRYDARNYDLVINVEGKTEDEVADLICAYID